VDLSKLTTADRVIAGSGIALLVFSFFTWFEAEVAGVVLKSDSAWGFTLGIVGVLIGVAMVAITVLPAFGVDLPDGLRSKRTTLVLGSLALAAVLLVVLFANYEGARGIEVDANRKLGAFLGLLAAAGLLAGAILRRRESAAPPPGAPPAPPQV
jgi:hypothetical protein